MKVSEGRVIHLDSGAQETQSLPAWLAEKQTALELPKADLPSELAEASIGYSIEVVGDAIDAFFEKVDPDTVLPSQIPGLLNAEILAVISTKNPNEELTAILDGLAASPFIKAEYADATQVVISESISRATWKAQEAIIGASMAYKLNDGVKYAQYRATFNAFGFTFPELPEQVAANNTSGQFRPTKNVDVSRSVKAATAAVATGAVLASVLATNPAAATESNPAQQLATVSTSTVNALTSEVVSVIPQEVAQNEPVPQTEELPQQIEQPVQFPEQETAEAIPEAAAPSTPAATIKPGKTTKTIDAITGEVVKKQKTEVTTMAENNAQAGQVVETLTEDISESIQRLNTAIKSGSLNDLSSDPSDTFSPQDPYNTKKVLPLKMSEELQADSAIKLTLLNGILANDAEVMQVIDIIFEMSPPPKDAQQIIDMILEASFSKKGLADLSDEQKRLAGLLLYDMQSEFIDSAEAQYDARLEKYEIAQKASEKNTKPHSETTRQNGKITEGVIDRVAEKYRWSKGKVAMFKALMNHGVPLAAAAGMMGNAKVESAGYNPGIEEFGNKIGFGYFQWSFGRRISLEKAAERQGVDPADPEFQIKYAIKESKKRSQRNNPRANEWAGMIALKDPKAAAAFWQWHFERPAVKPGQSARTDEAQKVYDQIMREITPETVKVSTLKDLPKKAGSRRISKAIANSAKPGESLYGPDDPCAELDGNVRVLCAAKKFFGVRYGTADPGYAPKWSGIWGQQITSWGGHNPRGWIMRNKAGSTNDFLECSGFVAVAFMAAYSVDVDNCSAGFLSDKKNFKEIDPKDVQPGDLVIAERWCGGKRGGHVGIVESYDSETNKLVTYESSAGTSSEGWAKSGRITHHKIGSDFKYAVRYIGPGSTADITKKS